MFVSTVHDDDRPRPPAEATGAATTTVETREGRNGGKLAKPNGYQKGVGGGGSPREIESGSNSVNARLV